MAYLPFYITPEEFAEYQAEQEQEIANGANYIHWHKYDSELALRYFYWLFMSVAAIPCFIVFLFFGFQEEDSTRYVIWAVGILAFLFFYFLAFTADYRFDYQLSDLGLVIKKRHHIPEWVNSAVQMVAWISAIGCVFMVVTVGPMILVGAGGTILLSFGMLKRQPDEPTDIRIAFREDWLFVHYNKKRKVIKFFHKYDKCRYRNLEIMSIFRSQSRGDSYLFFKTVADLEAMIDKLSNQYHIDCFEFSNHKDIFEAKIEPKLADTPVRYREFTKEDIAKFKKLKTPPPTWEYLHNGKWQTKAQINQENNASVDAKE